MLSLHTWRFQQGIWLQQATVPCLGWKASLFSTSVCCQTCTCLHFSTLTFLDIFDSCCMYKMMNEHENVMIAQHPILWCFAADVPKVCKVKLRHTVVFQHHWSLDVSCYVCSCLCCTWRNVRNIGITGWFRVWLVGGLEHFCSHILGMASSQLTNSIRGVGWNYQPVNHYQPL